MSIKKNFDDHKTEYKPVSISSIFYSIIRKYILANTLLPENIWIMGLQTKKKQADIVDQVCACLSMISTGGPHLAWILRLEKKNSEAKACEAD